MTRGWVCTMAVSDPCFISLSYRLYKEQGEGQGDRGLWERDVVLEREFQLHLDGQDTEKIELARQSIEIYDNVEAF